MWPKCLFSKPAVHDLERSVLFLDPFSFAVYFSEIIISPKPFLPTLNRFNFANFFSITGKIINNLHCTLTKSAIPSAILHNSTSPIRLSVQIMFNPSLISVIPIIPIVLTKTMKEIYMVRFMIIWF